MNHTTAAERARLAALADSIATPLGPGDYARPNFDADTDRLAAAAGIRRGRARTYISAAYRRENGRIYRGRHGGARPGAGRPAISADGESLERITLTLPAAQAEWLRRTGNASAEVRRLVGGAMAGAHR